MKRIFFAVAILSGLSIGTGCKSNSSTQVVYTGDAIPGTIAGVSTLYDSLYDNFRQDYALLSDASGISVQLEGTNFHAMTDAKGSWKIENVPPGVYNIIYQKDGFATAKTISKEFAGNGADYNENVSLYRISRITPELILRAFEDYQEYSPPRDTFFYDSSGHLQYATKQDSVFYPNGRAIFTINILDQKENTGRYFAIALFFGKGPDISATDPASYLYSFNEYYSDNGYYTSKGINIDILRKDLFAAGFSSDDKIYCVAYAGKNSLRTYYKDPATTRYVFTGFSPFTSGVKSFIIP